MKRQLGIDQLLCLSLMVGMLVVAILHMGIEVEVIELLFQV